MFNLLCGYLSNGSNGEAQDAVRMTLFVYLDADNRAHKLLFKTPEPCLFALSVATKKAFSRQPGYMLLSASLSR